MEYNLALLYSYVSACDYIAILVPFRNTAGTLGLIQFNSIFFKDDTSFSTVVATY